MATKLQFVLNVVMTLLFLCYYRAGSNHFATMQLLSAHVTLRGKSHVDSRPACRCRCRLEQPRPQPRRQWPKTTCAPTWVDNPGWTATLFLLQCSAAKALQEYARTHTTTTPPRSLRPSQAKFKLLVSTLQHAPTIYKLSTLSNAHARMGSIFRARSYRASIG